MKSTKRKKLPERTCAGCGGQFTPRRRIDQQTCNASCRYKLYTQNWQRLRVKTFDYAAKVWHYVKASNATEPCAYFSDRADAQAWAQLLRRRQRKQPLTERVRFALGSMLPRQNPDGVVVEPESKPLTDKSIGKSKAGLSINAAAKTKKKKNAK